ncbi:hypothetical protein SAMN04488540_10690 [Ferrimonas sediminum]|uniref:Uncharacterized protein n=1 Tax=Ferrimonas sediminum TaxID=718193 RepID=A0A1G8S7C7_9GAMM|nr:hypothetical protein [Ferrimonas sediminum]SDJ25083.1 hypothetical protein SAMN04488540_10690 [Ferrimonas sediminum]
MNDIGKQAFSSLATLIACQGVNQVAIVCAGQAHSTRAAASQLCRQLSRCQHHSLMVDMGSEVTSDANTCLSLDDISSHTLIAEDQVFDQLSLALEGGDRLNAQSVAQALLRWQQCYRCVVFSCDYYAGADAISAQVGCRHVVLMVAAGQTTDSELQAFSLEMSHYGLTVLAVVMDNRFMPRLGQSLASSIMARRHRLPGWCDRLANWLSRTAYCNGEWR